MYNTIRYSSTVYPLIGYPIELYCNYMFITVLHTIRLHRTASRADVRTIVLSVNRCETVHKMLHTLFATVVLYTPLVGMSQYCTVATCFVHVVLVFRTRVAGFASQSRARTRTRFANRDEATLCSCVV